MDLHSEKKRTVKCYLFFDNSKNSCIFAVRNGGIAQLARAPALQAGGRRFDSDYLHKAIRIS